MYELTALFLFTKFYKTVIKDFDEEANLSHVGVQFKSIENCMYGMKSVILMFLPHCKFPPFGLYICNYIWLLHAKF